MVSNKFSQGLPPLRVPVICKDKLAAGEDQDIPYPPDPIYYHYNVDIVFFTWHWVFSGVLPMYIYQVVGAATYWRSTPPPPADGEAATFVHNYSSGLWGAYIAHYVGGALKVNANNTGNVTNSPMNFTTGPFEINFAAYYTGTKEGNVMSFP